LNTTTGDSIIAKPGTSSTYYVTGANGACTTKDSINIHVGNLSVTTTATSSTICAGGSTSVNASGATSYKWSPSTGLSSTTGSVVTASPTVTTIYKIVGTSGLGCSDSTTDTITVNPLPSLSVSGNSSLVCFGAGGTTLNVNGATTYIWTPAGSLSCSTCTNPNANPNATTTYTVTGTSALGCSLSDTVSVQVDKLSISINATSGTICNGDTTSVNASGGTGYLWSPAASLTCATCASSIANPSSTTTYSVLITDALGCKDSTTTTVNVNPLPVVNLSASASSVCSGNADTLKASGATNYLWSPAASLSCATCPSTIATPTVTTTYTVIGTSSTGCNDTTTIAVAVSIMPVITVKLSGSGSDTVCSGQPVTLSANGGSGAITYLWSNGSTNTSITVTPGSDTVCSLIATNGPCADTLAKIPVYVYPQLNVTINSDTSCINRNATVIAAVSGGEPEYTYVWSTGAASSSITIVPLVNATTVSCTVQDACGTSKTASGTITAYTAPVVSFTANPSSILGGQYVAFIDSTTGATKYYWTFGNGTTSTAFDPYEQYIDAGTYTVTLIASNAGCSDTATRTVTVVEDIIVPNVFTPNGDGQNDVFHVTMSSMKAYHIEIFNRWGEKVFESDSPQIDWSGRSGSGVSESDGIYYYLLTATDFNNKEYNLHGYLQLIR
jgi:gliding motility-associated-like protein